MSDCTDCVHCECEDCLEVREKDAQLAATSGAILDSIRKLPHRSAKILKEHFNEFLAADFSGLSSKARGDEPATSFTIDFSDGSSITWAISEAGLE